MSFLKKLFDPEGYKKEKEIEKQEQEESAKREIEWAKRKEVGCYLHTLPASRISHIQDLEWLRWCIKCEITETCSDSLWRDSGAGLVFDREREKANCFLFLDSDERKAWCLFENEDYEKYCKRCKLYERCPKSAR